MNEQVQAQLKKIFNGRFSTSESTRANYARGEDTYDPVLSKAVVKAGPACLIMLAGCLMDPRQCMTLPNLPGYGSSLGCFVRRPIESTRQDKKAGSLTH